MIESLAKQLVNPVTYTTQTVHTEEVKDNFGSWLKSETGVIKAMVKCKWISKYMCLVNSQKVLNILNKKYNIFYK